MATVLGLALGDEADALGRPSRAREMPRPSWAEKPLISIPELDGIFFRVQGRRGSGSDDDLAVGEDAVYVEDEEFDLAGAVFGGHLSMILVLPDGRPARAATTSWWVILPLVGTYSCASNGRVLRDCFC